MAEIEEAMEMKPEEYLTYFEEFIFVADKKSGQKEPFADASGGETDRQGGFLFRRLWVKDLFEQMN